MHLLQNVHKSNSSIWHSADRPECITISITNMLNHACHITSTKDHITLNWAKYVNKINHGRTERNRVNKEKERRVILITISFLRNIINSYWVEMLSGLKVWSGMVYWSGLVWRWYLFHNVVSFHSNDKQFLFKSNHFRIERISNKTFKHTKNLVLYAIKIYDHSISKCDEIMLFCVLSCLADCPIQIYDIAIPIEMLNDLATKAHTHTCIPSRSANYKANLFILSNWKNDHLSG